MKINLIKRVLTKKKFNSISSFSFTYTSHTNLKISSKLNYDNMDISQIDYDYIDKLYTNEIQSLFIKKDLSTSSSEYIITDNHWNMINNQKRLDQFKLIIPTQSNIIDNKSSDSSDVDNIRYYPIEINDSILNINEIFINDERNSKDYENYIVHFILKITNSSLIISKNIMKDLNITLICKNSEINIDSIEKSNISLISNECYIRIGKMNDVEFNIFSENDDFHVSLIENIKNNSLFKEINPKQYPSFMICLLSAMTINVFISKTKKFEKFFMLDREGFSFCPSLIINSEREYKKGAYISYTKPKKFLKKMGIFSSFFIFILFLIDDIENYLNSNGGNSNSFREKYTYLKYTQIRLGYIFNNKI